MDLNRVLSLLGRLLLNTAMKHGMNYLARRGKPRDGATPADAAQAKSAQDMAKRARDIAKLSRRLGR